jgi:hypothetical protein
MNLTTKPQERTLTLAEVCEALTSGKLQASVQDGSYLIRRSDLRDLVRRNTITQVTRLARPTELAS